MGFGYNDEGRLKENLSDKITTPTTLDEMGEAKFKVHGKKCSIDEHGKLTANGNEIKYKKFKFALSSWGNIFAIDENVHKILTAKSDFDQFL